MHAAFGGRSKRWPEPLEVLESHRNVQLRVSVMDEFVCVFDHRLEPGDDADRGLLDRRFVPTTLDFLCRRGESVCTCLEVIDDRIEIVGSRVQ